MFGLWLSAQLFAATTDSCPPRVETVPQDFWTVGEVAVRVPSKRTPLYTERGSVFRLGEEESRFEVGVETAAPISIAQRMLETATSLRRSAQGVEGATFAQTQSEDCNMIFGEVPPRGAHAGEMLLVLMEDATTYTLALEVPREAWPMRRSRSNWLSLEFARPTSKGETGDTGEFSVTAVFARRALPAGTRVTPEDLAIVKFPARYVPSSAIRTHHPIIGRILGEAVYEMELLRPERFEASMGRRLIRAPVVTPPPMNDATLQSDDTSVIVTVAANTLEPGHTITAEDLYGVRIPPALLPPEPTSVMLAPDYPIGETVCERVLADEIIRRERLICP